MQKTCIDFTRKMVHYCIFSWIYFIETHIHSVEHLDVTELLVWWTASTGIPTPTKLKCSKWLVEHEKTDFQLMIIWLNELSMGIQVIFTNSQHSILDGKRK